MGVMANGYAYHFVSIMGGGKKKYSDESINGLEEIMDILKEGRQLRVESAEERLLLHLADYIWR